MDSSNDQSPRQTQVNKRIQVIYHLRFILLKWTHNTFLNHGYKSDSVNVWLHDYSLYYKLSNKPSINLQIVISRFFLCVCLHLFVQASLKIKAPSKSWPSVLSRSSFCCGQNGMLTSSVDVSSTLQRLSENEENLSGRHKPVKQKHPGREKG